MYKVRKYEETGIDNLSQVEKDDYFRTLQQIDKGAELNPSYVAISPLLFKKVDQPNSNKREYPGLKYKASNN